MESVAVVVDLRASSTGPPRVHRVRVMSEWPGTVIFGVGFSPLLLHSAYGSSFEDARRNALEVASRMHPWIVPFLHEPGVRRRRRVAGRSRSA